jgi:hypothetical protein
MLKRTLWLNFTRNFFYFFWNRRETCTPQQNVTLTTYFSALAAPPCYTKGIVPRDYDGHRRCGLM